jgi:LL-diaminopimelate aminotransferase
MSGLVRTKAWRADRLGRLGSSIFAEAADWKAEALQEGVDVIDLSIGSPDLPPSQSVRQALVAAAGRDDAFRYPSSRGSSAFRQAASEWLAWRFGVSVDPDGELLTLMGSQDGLAHLALAVCNPGDTAIVPDPGYPIYTAGLAAAGVEPYYAPLRSENGYLPDLDAIPDAVWDRARYILLNYPSNPVSAVADLEFFERLVAKARLHGVLVVHDLAYSEMAYDGYRPPSILHVEGAMDTAVEFHSLSKSFNLAGGRIGFIAGNREAVGALRDLKANLDYGVFEAVQEAGIAALREDMARGNADLTVGAVYQHRRDVFVSALQREGWAVPLPQATMFVWAPLPAGDWSSRAFARELVRQAGVAVVPGSAFGAEGEGYVRIALVEEAARLEEAARRIGQFIRNRTSSLHD